MLAASERDFLARAWLDKARGEHASVASFARFLLHLMKLGSPPDLLLATTRAIEDEVRHARACFGVAARFSGARTGPGPLDLRGVLDVADDTESILDAAIVEGCIGETISTRYAEVSLERTRDEGIRRVLARLVEDERRHSELAWQFVEWMLVREQSLLQTARASFERALTTPGGEGLVYEPEVADQFGHLRAGDRMAVRESEIREGIRPRLSALLKRLQLPASQSAG